MEEHPNCVLIALPNWLKSDNKVHLLLSETLKRDIQDNRFQNLTYKVQTQVLRNANQAVYFDDLEKKHFAHCGFCFGSLPHDYDRKKYLPISNRRVFEAIFSSSFVRDKQDYTPELQKVVFWYAVEFFAQKGGTMGTPFSANQIADFLSGMPIWFWKV